MPNIFGLPTSGALDVGGLPNPAASVLRRTPVLRGGGGRRQSSPFPFPSSVTSGGSLPAPALPPIVDPLANPLAVGPGALPPSQQGTFNAAAVPTGTPPGSIPNTNPAYVGAPLEGFASRYIADPTALEMLQREPGVVLADTLQSMGINPSGGVYGLMEPSADLVNALSQIFLGDEFRSQGDILNYFNQFFEQGATPGGQAVDFRAGLSNMLNAASDSPLGTFLRGAKDPRSQVETFRALASALSAGGMPLLMQEAFNNQLALIARDYLRAHAEGRLGRGDFSDYVGARRSFAPFVGPNQAAAAQGLG